MFKCMTAIMPWSCDACFIYCKFIIEYTGSGYNDEII